MIVQKYLSPEIEETLCISEQPLADSSFIAGDVEELTGSWDEEI